MQESDQLGMFQDPEGDLLCRCGHAQMHHGGKLGRGGCSCDCACDRFKGSGARLPPPPPRPTSRAKVEPGKPHIALLHVLSYCGPVTDETLIRAYEEAVRKRAVIVQGIPMPRQSPAEIRAAREELFDMDMVVGHDTVRGSVRWKVNEKNKKATKIIAARARRGI